jgi:hypothetical protein
VVRRLALLLAVALVACAVLAPAAAARRAPTQAEAVAIRAATAAYVARPGGAASGSIVKRIFVSTVDARFAMAKLRAPGEPVLSTAILKRREGRWTVVTFGVAGFAFKGVPRSVLNDLLGAEICDC